MVVVGGVRSVAVLGFLNAFFLREKRRDDAGFCLQALTFRPYI